MEDYITLEDYQRGKIKFQPEDFIYYINNPHFYSRWDSIVKLPGIYGIFLNFLEKLKLSSPNKKSIFFLGYNERSINSNRLIIKTINSSGKLSEQNNVIVLGKGDYEIDDDFAEEIPAKIKFLFGNNLNTESCRFKYLPMGRDFRGSSLFTEVMPSYNKELLCYCNYSVNTHPVRKYLYGQLEKTDFIKFEHMGKFLNYNLSRREFFEKVSKSKFTICPRGNGLDTFRLWDSLYLGAVPIVVREAVFHDYLTDLPILFLDNYEQFSEMSVEKLNNCYQRMLKTKYNYSKLRFSFWLDQIENC